MLKYLLTALVMLAMIFGCSKSSKVSIVVSDIEYSTSIYHQSCDIHYLLTDGKGNPFQQHRVDFELIQGDALGTLSKTSDLTNDEGKVNVTINAKPPYSSQLNLQVKATVYGYDASITTSLKFEIPKIKM